MAGVTRYWKTRSGRRWLAARLVDAEVDGLKAPTTSAYEAETYL